MAAEPPPAGADRPRTTLGLFDITCVVVGGIIGVGIFFTPGRVAAAVDGAEQVIVAWCLGGLVAILGALVFAQLSCLRQGHGGIFVYLHDAFGPLPAFLYGWSNWLVVQAGAIAVVSLIVADNLDDVTGVPSSPATRMLIATGSILLLTVVNVLGLRLGKGVQNTLTVIKTLAVFALVVLPLVVAAPAPSTALVEAQPQEPKGWLSAMAASILLVLFSYGGWQHGSFLAGAARRPARDVPLGIVFGVLIVVVAYLTVNLAFLDMLGFDAARNTSTIAVDAVEHMLQAKDGVGSRLLAAMIVASALGVMNTQLLAPPYVLHAMAKRQLFFKVAGSLHARFQTPVLPVLVQGLWAVVLLLASYFYYVVHGQQDHLTQLDTLVTGVVFMDWLFFTICGVAVFKLRRMAASTDQQFGGVVVASLFTVMALAITAGGVWKHGAASGVGLAIAAVGLLAYGCMRRLQSRGSSSG